MKVLSIKIQINEESDSLEEVKDLIFGVMEVCGDKFFSIDSVEIEDKEVFSIKNGFDKNFKI